MLIIIVIIFHFPSCSGCVSICLFMDFSILFFSFFLLKAICLDFSVDLKKTGWHFIWEKKNATVTREKRTSIWYLRILSFTLTIELYTHFPPQKFALFSVISNYILSQSKTTLKLFSTHCLLLKLTLNMWYDFKYLTIMTNYVI